MKKTDVLHDKVDEIAEYGKVTVEALGRLETQSQQLESREFEMQTSRSFSSISSQLSRIETFLFSGSGPISSPVPQKPFNPPRIRRTGSTSSLCSTHSASHMISESRRNSISSSPIRATQDIFQVGGYDYSFRPLSARRPKDFYRANFLRLACDANEKKYSAD